MPRLLEMFEQAGLVVIDKRPDLRVNPNKAPNYRGLDDCIAAFVHHTGGWPTATAEGINDLHIRFGWSRIAYTFYIRPNGEMDFCKLLREWDSQVGSTYWNPLSFGMALAGGFVHQRPNPRMVGTLVTAIEVLDAFLLDYTGSRVVVRPHFAVSSTACPGLAWDAYLAASGN